MLDELECRNYSASTIRAYVRTVEDLARYFKRPPDRLGPEHIRQYQAHLFRDRKLHANTVAQRVACSERPEALPPAGASKHCAQAPVGNKRSNPLGPADEGVVSYSSSFRTQGVRRQVFGDAQISSRGFDRSKSQCDLNGAFQADAARVSKRRGDV